MKILILENDIGCVANFRKEMIEELMKQHEVSVSVPEGEGVDVLKTIGCKVKLNRFLERHGLNPFQDMRLKKYYECLMEKVQPDIVFTYTIKPNVYGGMACAKRKISYVANITGLGTAVENGGILQRIALLLYRKGLKRAQKVFFQNEANMRFMIKKGIVTGEYSLLPGSGVNTARHCYEEYPSDKDGLIFTTIGRIMKDKGINEILTAAKIIKEQNPQCRFRLIGGFDEDYEAKVQAYEDDGVVEYIESQKDIHRFIAESHAILHASYHEGMSNVLLEGASTGRPVIATNVPGCREAYVEGVSGIGFQPQSVEDMVRAIRLFIGLPHEKREEMGKAGRRKMEREFDRSIVVRAYMKELDKVMESTEDVC